MRAQVITLGDADVGEVSLDETIFALEPRADILHRVVRWQLAKRQAGTHKVKTRSEVAYSTHKIVRQKGSGGARHGSRRAPIFRKGGVYKGPTPRSHAHDLPKKIRVLGLKHALSSKAREGKLLVLENPAIEGGKTRLLKEHLKNLGLRKVLFIDGCEVDKSFLLASRNISDVDVIPSTGANVYDILRRDKLVLTRAGLDGLEARLK